MQNRLFPDFEKESRQYSTILQNFAKNGTQYVDTSFHPTKNLFEKEVQFSEKDTIWERIDKYFKFPLFDPKLIHPNYVQQGELGDCYFISALTRIAAQPHLVKDLFDTETPKQILGEVSNSVNLQSGAVVIYLYAFGRKTPVLIDTLIPFKRGTRQPRFVHPSDIIYSAWMCLVEKAYAKLQGSYSSIIGGSFIQAIYNIFGYYSQEIEIKSLNNQTKLKQFDQLLNFYNNSYAMDASISLSNLPKTVSVNMVEDLGLCTSHSYLIQKVQRVQNIELVCLRNPWGDHEWLGDWSDTSDLWTEELRNAFNSRISNDGTFWMCWADFSKFFTTIHISKEIPRNLKIKSFELAMKHDKYDGYTPSSIQGLNAKDRNAYIFQLIDKPSSNNKCTIKILVEKRSILFDEKKKVFYQQNQTGLVFREETNSAINWKTITSNGDLFSFEYQIDASSVGVDISLHRLRAMPMTEYCYVKIMCDCNFKLFNANTPNNCLQYVQVDGSFPDQSSPKQKTTTISNLAQSKAPPQKIAPAASAQKLTPTSSPQKISTSSSSSKVAPNSSPQKSSPLVMNQKTEARPTAAKQKMTTVNSTASRSQSKQSTSTSKPVTNTKQQTSSQSKQTNTRPNSKANAQIAKVSTTSPKPPVTSTSQTLNPISRPHSSTAPQKRSAAPSKISTKPPQSQNQPKPQPAAEKPAPTTTARLAPKPSSSNPRASTSLVPKAPNGKPNTNQNTGQTNSTTVKTSQTRKTVTISPTNANEFLQLLANMPEGTTTISEHSCTVQTRTSNNVVITEKKTEHVTISYKKTVW